MLWVLIDALIALLALVGLGLVLLRLWRRIRALSRQVSQASDAVSDASETLAAAHAPASGRR